MIIINALKSIARSKGRNILIGIIVLTIVLSSCIALAIKNAAETAKTSGLEAQTITATISVNRQKLMEGAQGEPGQGQADAGGMRELMQLYSGLSLSEMQGYAQSNFVKTFYYTATASLNASGELEPYSTTGSSETDNAGGMQRPGGMGGMSFGDFSLVGYSGENAMARFVSGEAKITEGEMFNVSSAEANCLISSELAALNGLGVNDVITLANPANEKETYAFTIVGVFSNSGTSGEEGQLRVDPANLICVSYPALAAVTDHSVSVAVTNTNDSGFESSSQLSAQTSGTYVFANKADYESFGTELTAKGLSEYYALSSTDISNYEASLIPLNNLSSFATTLLLIILAVGAVVLIVLNIFSIRERKYEVGVLTAIGVKKWKVALQFVTELLAVSLVAVLLGAGMGAVASVPVSNALLASQISAQETQATAQQENFGRPGGMQGQNGGMGGVPGGAGIRGGGRQGMFGNATNAVEYLSTINAAVNINIVLQLVGIGVLLTILSSLVGVVFVLRYEPLKILANRA